MYKVEKEFLSGLSLYLDHLLNPSLMTVSDWIITALLVIAAVSIVIFCYKLDLV